MSVDTHDSPRTITWSPAPTLGVEQELHTVDETDLDLVSAAPAIIETLHRDHGLETHVHTEYMSNTIELTTPPSVTVGEAVSSLRRVHGVAARVATTAGVLLSPISIHPFGDPGAQTVTDTPRYHSALDREQSIGQEQQIIGVHIHVGVPDGDAAVRAMDELARLTPLFVALAASSPFHRGADTGFESFRPMLGDRLPPAGVAPHFDTWSSFETWYDGMAATGYVGALTDIWWDVRPSRHGTVELRVCDGPTSFERIAALTALAQCAVAATLDPTTPRHVLPTDLLRLNRFEAQRYGTDGAVSLEASTPRRPIAEHIEAEVARLLPVARHLGCEAELSSLSAMVRQGSSARHQRQAFVAGGMTGVVRGAIAELNSAEGLGA